MKLGFGGYCIKSQTGYKAFWLFESNGHRIGHQTIQRFAECVKKVISL